MESSRGHFKTRAFPIGTYALESQQQVAGDTHMSSVNNIGSSNPVQKLATVATTPVQKQVPTDAPKQVRVSDKVELSGMSHLMAALRKNDVRAEKVDAIKAQIAAGTYDDEKKL